MNTLFILNDAPYGSERSYNALRLARALGKKEGETVRVFLMGDSVACAKAGQKVPEGYYNAGDMVRMVGGEVALCGTCLNARGIAETSITLLALPVIYSLLDDARGWLRNVLRDGRARQWKRVRLASP